MTPIRLIVVRHGESEGNVAREEAEAEQADVITIGQRDPDVPLSARGRAQAAAVGRWLAEFLRDEPAPTAWSSPYVRARQTAEIAFEVAGRRLPIPVDDRLRDRELGILDLLTGRGVAARYPEEAVRRRWLGKLYYRPPGGESWADVALRLRSFLGERLDDHVRGPVLLFCHDAVITLIRYVLEGLEEAELLEIARTRVVANGSITSLERSPDGAWKLIEFDDRSHLREAGVAPTEHEGEVDDARPR